MQFTSKDHIDGDINPGQITLTTEILDELSCTMPVQ